MDSPTPEPISTQNTGASSEARVTVVDAKTIQSRDAGPQAHSTLLVWGLLVIVVVGTALGLWWKFGRASTTAPKQAIVTTTPHPSITPLTGDALVLQKMSHPTTGETWLEQPVVLPDQGYFADQSSGSQTLYYKVGVRGTSTIIMSIISQIGDYVQLYEKTAIGQVSVILRPDGQTVYNSDTENNQKLNFVKSLSFDITTHYDSLTLPAKTPIDKGYSLTKAQFTDLGSLIRPDQDKESGSINYPVATYGKGVIQRRETANADTKLTSIGYVFETPIHTRIPLNYLPIETDLSQFQWTSGNRANDTIAPISYGCGGLSISATKATTVTDSDVVLVGKSPSGVAVYHLKSLDDPIVVKAYSEFIAFYRDSPSSTSFYNISKTGFASNHGVILAKDNFGQWLVYSRNQLRAVGGCAKPVVYLYPTVPSNVKVHVGAFVKISKPNYDPVKGWDVWAAPNGKLLEGGKSYDSLLWEGTGSGPYPVITSGTVIARPAAPSTMRLQLAQQGLKQNEIDDFMAYWEPRLPDSPYVRLTWFNTAQMDALAPLTISPIPKTVIRVFLDFEGLSAPTQLPPQRLATSARNGFTVVEWGGLAHLKLY